MTSWDEPKDARVDGGEYPNYTITKTPSGHVLNMDDTKGKESVTLQHRSGSMIQMHPDGSVRIRTHGTKYDVTFGDGKMLVTGDMDITVNGGGSLLVEGDYDVTVGGNMNTTVTGNMETVVAGNMNTVVTGNQDTAVDGNQTTKIAGNTEHTTEGKTYIAGDGGIAIESTAGNTRIASNDNINLRAGGTLESESDGATTIIGSVIDLNP